jgi:hypothetical protein
MNTGRFDKTGSKRGGRLPVAAVLLALACAITFSPAHADSTIVEAKGARAVANGHLDFKIVVPKVLQLNANAGTLFTNAARAETIVIASADREASRAIAIRSDAGAIRVAMAALARDAARSPVRYTVAMP